MGGRNTLLGLMLLSLAATVRAEEAISWGTEIKPALGAAASAGRPVFVDFWAVWCKPCKLMEETTYRDPAVVAAMAAFVPLKVDQDVQDVFAERYQVDMLPLVLFLDGEGREISRLAGLVEAEQLLGVMKSVSEGYAGYLSAVEHPKDTSAQVTVAHYLLDAGNPEEAAKLLRKVVKALDEAPTGEREALEFDLARAQVASGDTKAGAASLERLAGSAATPDVRGGALEALVRLWRERGDVEQATAAFERLRTEFPARAAGLSS